METEYICNMDKIATIEIHQSEETGKYYFHFICWNGRGYDGLWQDSKELSTETLNNVYEIIEKNTDIFTKEQWEKEIREDWEKRGMAF